MKIQIMIGLVCLALLSLAFALVKGSTSVGYEQVFAAFSGQADAVTMNIVWHLRLPRVWAAFVTGGLLALSGSLMQILLRNPLADPYVLGISGGAAFGALLAILMGLSGTWLIGSAWIGALGTILLTTFLVRGQIWLSSRLLLTGISLACGFSALISFILCIAPDRVLHSLLFWLIGDLNETSIPYIETLCLVGGLLYALYLAPALNILSRGDKEAQALGVNTKHLQWVLYILSSLLTACAVALAGCIGFIGLIAPHFLRILLGHDHKLLLVGSVLLGGSLLTLADLFSRTLFAPQELPVGIMMTLLGIPLFLVLLEKKKYL